jgi:hypothetical protein
VLKYVLYISFRVHKMTKFSKKDFCMFSFEILSYENIEMPTLLWNITYIDYRNRFNLYYIRSPVKTNFVPIFHEVWVLKNFKRFRSRISDNIKVGIWSGSRVFLNSWWKIIMFTKIIILTNITINEKSDLWSGRNQDGK